MDVRLLGTEDFANAAIAGPYPNPASESVRFDFNELSENMTVTVSNILGQRLTTFTFDAASENSLELPIARYDTGVLFVTFEGSFGRSTKKIIKK